MHATTSLAECAEWSSLDSHSSLPFWINANGTIPAHLAKQSRRTKREKPPQAHRNTPETIYSLTIFLYNAIDQTVQTTSAISNIQSSMNKLLTFNNK